MSLHQLLLQFSALTIVIKQEEEATVYEQLSNFYDILNSPLNWSWPLDVIQTVKHTDQRIKLFCMTVTFSRRQSAIGIGYRTWCNISFDGVHVIYDNYVPAIIDSQPEPEEEGLKVRQCDSCKMYCVDFYPDITRAPLFNTKESVILIHVKMEDKITNLKIEIAECIDIIMHLVCRRFIMSRPENFIKNVIFTKSLSPVNKATKKAKVIVDGVLAFDAPQCTSVGNHDFVSLFCSCKKI